jgi:hypothetical protein
MCALPLTVAVLLLSVITATPTGFQSAAPPNAATLDFVVTGPSSRPNTLSPGGISLKIDGRQQTIHSVETIAPTAQTPRYILLMIDEATLYALEPIVKDAVAKLLASLKPSDLVASASTRRAAARTDMSAQRDRVTAAVNAMVTGPGTLYTCQRDLTKVIAKSAAGLPRGRSTSLVVISRGHPDGAAEGSESDADPCTPRRQDLRELEEAIAVAQLNLHLFTVSDTQRSWGFDTIAGNAGGTSGLLTWSDHEGLTRAIQSTETYYRVTFDWNAPSDRAQRVDLRANDRRLKLRTSSVMLPK